MNQPPSWLDVTGAAVVLVRGATAPPDPPDTVSVAPGVSATAGVDGRRAPLVVSADAPCGKTVRQFEYGDVPAAADCAARFVAERDPASLWLCGRERLVAWWSERTARIVERRLATAARSAGVPLIVWADRDGDGDVEPPADGRHRDDGGCDGTERDAGAERYVTERYDEVIDA